MDAVAERPCPGGGKRVRKEVRGSATEAPSSFLCARVGGRGGCEGAGREGVADCGAHTVQEQACEAQGRATDREVALLGEVEAQKEAAALLLRAEKAEALAARLARQLSCALRDTAAATAS